jgi:hypothetical protein
LDRQIASASVKETAMNLDQLQVIETALLVLFMGSEVVRTGLPKDQHSLLAKAGNSNDIPTAAIRTLRDAIARVSFFGS